MAIAFAYNPATNIAVLTGGTVGIPATFADFVTADRAGTYTIMDAIATAMNLTLDRLIRPVEFRALKVTFTLTGTNAGAGDTIDITGTDAWGNAQTESINVAAGNGSYISAKYWRTITDIDCTGFADGVGTIAATQGQWGVIWDYGNGQYRIDAQFNIGDAVAPTYFATVGEASVLPSHSYAVVANATFTCGEIANGYGGKTTYLKFQGKAYDPYFCNGGTVNFYNTIIDYSGDTYLVIYGASTVNIRRLSVYSGGEWFLIRSTTTFDIDDFYLYDSRLYLAGNLTNNGFTGVHSDGDSSGVAFASETLLDIDQLNVTNPVNRQMGIGVDTSLIDPLFHPVRAKIYIFVAGKWIKEKYTCNIHIADRDGANLASVTILCEDTDGTQVFLVSTDASGDIIEQQITYRQWVDTTETETTYSPHKFTISKAGYETLVMENITVDVPIIWHLELLPALLEADVRETTVFGEDKTGTLDLPAIEDVEKGVQFDGLTKTGTFKKPAEADVRDGEGYGAGDVEFIGVLDLPVVGNVRDGIKYDNETKEGILDLPSEDDVEDGVKYDNETKEGNFGIPAEEDVEVGVKYGANGVEFEGTYLGLKGNNLTAALEKSVDLIGHLKKTVSLTAHLEKTVSLTAHLEKTVDLSGHLDKKITLEGELGS